MAASPFNKTWTRVLSSVLAGGLPVAPRGKNTLELAHGFVGVNMRKPVLTIAERKLSYPFMAAEAHWILSGSDKVADIAPWNKNISAFSDDGEKFFGAYGPKIVAQLPYVVAKLAADKDSRQAGLTIWRESPPETKDVPCTVAIFASIRKSTQRDGPMGVAGLNLLHLHVFMRSSDLWLGLPYDVFNFSMLAHLICAHLNDLSNMNGADLIVSPGTLYLTAASMHLYEEQWAAARQIVALPVLHEFREVPDTPPELFGHPDTTLACLGLLRDSKPGDPMRWWEYAP